MSAGFLRPQSSDSRQQPWCCRTRFWRCGQRWSQPVAISYTQSPPPPRPCYQFGPAQRGHLISALQPCVQSPDYHQTGRRIPAGQSHRPESVACAATIADPRDAAGPGLRSRRAIVRRGRGRFWTRSRPAFRSICGRRCFPVVVRLGPAS